MFVVVSPPYLSQLCGAGAGAGRPQSDLLTSLPQSGMKHARAGQNGWETRQYSSGLRY